MTASVFTPWASQKPPCEPLSDEERHALFAKHVREVADHKLPYLFPLLDVCHASIYTQPGTFMFSIGYPARWYEVPELAHVIAAVPWTEQDIKPQ